MFNHPQTDHVKTAKSLIVSVAVFFVCSIVMLWSWNTLAVDLFHMPQAQFKHALAFAASIAMLFFLRRISVSARC